MGATNGEAVSPEPGVRARHVDDLLEEALIESFPASDPPAIDVEDRAGSSTNPRESRTRT